MFTTEGHVVSVDQHLRESPWKDLFAEGGRHGPEAKAEHRPKSPDPRVINSSANVSAAGGSAGLGLSAPAVTGTPAGALL